MVGCWRKTADDWAIRDCAAVSYRQLDCEKNIGGGMENGRRRIYSMAIGAPTSERKHLPVLRVPLQSVQSHSSLMLFHPSPNSSSMPLSDYLLQFGRCSFSFFFLLVFRWFFPFIFIKNSESMCAANVADTQLWQTERVLSDCKYTHIQVFTHPSHAYTQ